MERIPEKLRVVFFPNPEESDNFFSVEDIADEHDAYRVSSILERLALWFVEMSNGSPISGEFVSPEYIITVEMYDASPQESPDLDNRVDAVGWVHYKNYHLDGDGTWKDWVNTYIK